MNAAIVTIGDEILIGQVEDTNSVWMARELTTLGIHVSEMVSISDTPDHITKTLDRLIAKVELIFMTGGLGPTKDDLTKETLADYFEGKLIINQKVLNKIESYFRKRGRSLLESNKKQALVPDNCKILDNNHGTASGMWFTKNNTQIISMPGVPYEMKPMFSDQVLPEIKKSLKIPVLINKTIMTQGVPESYLAEMIKDWEENLPDCMKLAYLPRPGIVRLRLTVNGACSENPPQMLDDHVAQLSGLISDHIYGYGDVLLEKVIGELLAEKKLTLSAAESCTGGNISRLITSIPGSSAYFSGAIVAYSNAVKHSQLGVDMELIEKHGAVSREVVESMALGSNKRTKSDVSIATSGIAGPDGGTKDKPVGMVWIAVAEKEKVLSKQFNFSGHRELVIEQASIAALGMLRRLLTRLN